MQQHPIQSSVPKRILAALFVLLNIVLQFILLDYYTSFPRGIALADSLVYAGLFATYGFMLWYTTVYVKAIQVQIVLTILVQAVCIAGSYMVVTAFHPELYNPFISTIPFRLLYGILGWLVLVEWYRIKQLEQEQLDTESATEEKQAHEEQVLSIENTMIDRVSVKDGARIHIIPVQEILYIQACGDYVTLFSVSGQFVKEQTMKYFVEHLPPEEFVRIHRSCIVNVGQIARVELFGKETYQIRLKDNICLKASIAGYKLLKERLSI